MVGEKVTTPSPLRLLMDGLVRDPVVPPDWPSMSILNSNGSLCWSSLSEGLRGMTRVLSSSSPSSIGREADRGEEV